MSFDKETRNLLARTVGTCRRRLVDDVTDQLRGMYGLHPDGTVLPIEQLTHLSPDQATAASRLRDLQEHYAAGAAVADADRRKAAFERMTLEIAFTALNRLAALRLCEERGLVVECVRKGTASDGFQMFERISGGALGGRFETYRVFLECLFDELALDLGVLFDRTTPQSAIFPTERCVEDVLAELNKEELSHLWTEDETIGWIYQYFNPPEERRAMRDASQAPRNSRELAVRNQFFTPRYVVEFLTDNTLGRIWYEMRKGDTALKDECRFLVRRPNEIFLVPGERVPAVEVSATELSQEELLKKPVYIEHRPKKDPRDLRVLDPACGSGHFLLYAFDLLERIYEEAWVDVESPPAEVNGQSLQEEFQTLDELRRAAPKLIIEHNLYGIDIDPRAVQIAALALWLRAQKTWKRLGVRSSVRQRISSSHIVTAEPMPGEDDMRREFTAGLKPTVLGQLVDTVFVKMKLAGEAGSLLKIEEEIKDVVAEARTQWIQGPKLEQADLFPELVQPKPEQQQLRFDLTGVTNEEFWKEAEDRILAALKYFAEKADQHTIRRRLFAHDTARGFALIDLSRQSYDTVLMNPPFGNVSLSAKRDFERVYTVARNDIYAAFVERGIELLSARGLLGAITSRTGFFLTSFVKWREKIILGKAQPIIFADLGYGVMDTAVVEAAAYCLGKYQARSSQTTIFLRALQADDDKGGLLLSEIHRFSRFEPSTAAFDVAVDELSRIPGCPFAYWVPPAIRRVFWRYPPFENERLGRTARCGLGTLDDFRFLRLTWEIEDRSDDWKTYYHGGVFSPFYDQFPLLVNWYANGKEVKTFVEQKVGSASRKVQGEDLYFHPGFVFPRRTKALAPKIMPAGGIYSTGGQAGFLAGNDILAAIALLSARFCSYLISLTQGRTGDAAQFEVGLIKRLPWPDLQKDSPRLTELALRAWALKRSIDKHSSTSPAFVLPASLRIVGSDFQTSFADWSGVVRSVEAEVSNVQAEIDERCFDLYEIDSSHRAHVYGTSNAISSRDDRGDAETAGMDVTDNIEMDEVGDGGDDIASFVSEALAWGVGVALGRFDVRFALAVHLWPSEPNPFAPLPAHPPGLLMGPHGRCAMPGTIVSDEWLRARPDANTLPIEGAVSKPSVPDSEYPIRVSWDGILVDDPGTNGSSMHRDDIVCRLREVFDVLWKGRAYEVEQESCEILKVSNLRDYFRKPAGFFLEHLKRYSKCRRKAPIYWPLSTASGSYTIWIYYHRLTDQTLYKAVNLYVEPKIAEVDRDVARLEEETKLASGREAVRLTDQLSEARSFLGELRVFREELLRIAALPYRPNLNDGVIINAAPFHKLFRLRSWAKDTEECWKSLAKGDYDWAHLAYMIWPDRVREVCKRDRSIAIAHGLGDLCEFPTPGAKKKTSGRGKRKAAAAEEES